MAGSNKETQQLFVRYGPMVYRRALFLLGNQSDAEDALQEVFIRAFSNLHTFREEAKPSTWLHRITTNYCLNSIRNRKRQIELLEQQEGDPSVSAAQTMTPSERLFLLQLFALADSEQAMAAVCIFLDGMTRPETAKTMGVSLRKVGNLLERFSEWAKREVGKEEQTILSGIGINPIGSA